MPIANPQSDRFKRGQDILLTFTADSSISSMIGWSLKFSVAAYQGGTLLITKLTPSDVTILSATVCTVSLAALDTNNIPAGLYYWDLQRTDPGLATNIANGTLYFDLDVG